MMKRLPQQKPVNMIDFISSSQKSQNVYSSTLQGKEATSTEVNTH